MSQHLMIKRELDTDTLLFTDTGSPPKKCKLNIKQENEETAKKRVTVFSKKWLELPEFKGWLTEGLLPHHGFCSVCKITISATKSELLSHSKAKKHIRNLVIQKQYMKRNNEDIVIIDNCKNENNMRIIDLRCDSVTLPSKEMIYAMLEAPTGDTSFDTDSSVKELEEYLARMLCQESGLFFPTHTMANLVAVLAHCQSRGSAVIAGEDSDITINNQEALVKFGGLHFCPVNENEDGTFALPELEQRLNGIDRTFPLSCLVCFECPHARKGGRVPHQKWIEKLVSLCASEDVLLHCDGTRLINAAVSQTSQPSRLVSECDSVTFALDKGLGAPLGAVLVGKEVFIKRAALIRNFIGGNVHQAGIFAAAGTFALGHNLAADVDWDHDKAKAIAMAISQVNSCHVKVSDVETNVVNLQCVSSSFNAKYLRARLTSVIDEEVNYFNGESIIVLTEDINQLTLSMMVHKNISDDDTKAAIKKLVYVLEECENNFSKYIRL